MPDLSDDEFGEYAHEEILQALVRYLLTSGDLDQLCDDADLPHLVDDDGDPVTITSARVYRDAQVMTLDRGVWLELSDGSVFGLTVIIARRPRNDVTLRRRMELVGRVPGLGGALPEVVNGYVDWLYGLYPAAGTGGGLGTLQPDLLAEDLAVAVLRESTPTERSRILQGLAPGQAVQALTVLSRARTHQSDAAAMIDVALTADVPVMTEAVLQVGLQFPGMLAPRVAALLVTAELDPDWAWRTARRVPYPSIEFGQIAVALTTHALRAGAAPTKPNDRPLSLAWHAIRLAEVGRHAEALAASQESVNLYRELAANHDAYIPNLARSVNNHALRLVEVGRHAEALATSQEAVDLRRELAATNRDAYLPDLATSVNNHAVRLAEVGRHAEALATSQEAVNLYRELAAANRDAYLPDLATSVNNHAVRLAEVGRHAEALETIHEAVNLYRELAAANRDAYLPDLATSVHNHALRMLTVVGRHAEALATSQEAVNLYRELAAANRDAYLPDLAASVNNQAGMLAMVGRHAEALAASQEAVDLRRELAAANRDAYLPDLATSVNNQAAMLAETGRRDEALAASQEAVDLRRELAAANRDAYLPDLARSLVGVGYVARILGETSEQILDAVSEGVRYFEELAATEPQAFTAHRDAAASTLTDLQNSAVNQHPTLAPPRSPHADEAAPDTA
ncbi:tetratricopeptide repeat protein [Micromonospora sp. B11E3]|uniref:tetratricopeptide repeat protein n=1 Tax=Micromonospora sp. B11E3 TaxID=3153562 RepID=UPI00325CA3D1